MFYDEGNGIMTNSPKTIELLQKYLAAQGTPDETKAYEEYLEQAFEDSILDKFEIISAEEYKERYTSQINNRYGRRIYVATESEGFDSLPPIFKKYCYSLQHYLREVKALSRSRRGL